MKKKKEKDLQVVKETVKIVKIKTQLSNLTTFLTTE